MNNRTLYNNLYNKIVMPFKISMITFWTVLGFTALVALPQGSAQALEKDTGRVIAQAVANLVKNDQEVDFLALARELKLPGLEEKMTWQGPFDAHTSQRFSAYYFPSESELGVKRVFISWSPYRSPSAQAKFLNVLELEFSSTSCPTSAALEESIGSKPNQYTSLGYDGGPSYDRTSFSVPQGNDDPVFVSFNGTDTCRITVSRTRGIFG